MVLLNRGPRGRLGGLGRERKHVFLPLDLLPVRLRTGRAQHLVLSCLLTFYTAVMSFEILFPFGLWVFEPDWLLNHSQLV